ncbi:MAG: MiaB/RimO family radical SAM methylthiotransferase [Candidatus Cryosericum sp.]
MTKVFISTLGCKVNEVDSELYAQELRALGVVTTSVVEDADVVIVNSCSVTNKAQAQSLQTVRRALRERPGVPVYLTGCGAALLALTHKDAPAGVTVVSMRERSDVARLITGSVDAEQHSTKWVEGKIRQPGPRNRVDVRVQEGCDNMCTYCVVPFVRGTRLESKSIRTAVEEVVGLAKAGVKEVVLTGTEIGKYGEAPDKLPVLLDSMLDALEKAGLPTRVRISSLNPDAITDALVTQFSRHAALCPQLHLPLQSGSDAVLTRMHRPYVVADLLDSVRRLRSVDARFTFTTDVIVGFPGETEQDFLATVETVRAGSFAKVHVFPYSPRPFTPAAREEGQVPAGVVRERVHRMLTAAEEVGLSFARQFIGRSITIVSEKVGPGMAAGYSEHYLWTEAMSHCQQIPARDSFVHVRADDCRFEGDRVVLTGSVLS